MERVPMDGSAPACSMTSIPRLVMGHAMTANAEPSQACQNALKKFLKLRVETFEFIWENATNVKDPNRSEENILSQKKKRNSSFRIWPNPIKNVTFRENFQIVENFVKNGTFENWGSQQKNSWI